MSNYETGKNDKSYGIKKRRPFKTDPVEQRKFDDLRKKYANAIVYLLIKNVQQSSLRGYFNSEDGAPKYEKMKKFRQDIIDARPAARQWVDKPWYLGVKLGKREVHDDGQMETELILGECVFKQQTQAVGSKLELEAYAETIAKIIDSEKVWADPDMADFDLGERDDLSQRLKKKLEEAKCD
jgi:hypothetical protein